jgi:hypothetical protein
MHRWAIAKASPGPRWPQIPILAHLAAGGAGLDPIALKAVTALREAAALQ